MYQKINTKNYQQLMEQYNIASLLAKVICSFDYDEHDLTSFFHPMTSYQLDEKVFEPVKGALLQIAQNHQKVFIFGDYDCDGICATTIMIEILKALNIEYGYYLPSRINEGYGLNLDRLKQAKEKGYDVLVTVDNGVSCQSQLDWAKENGMLTIVTDHHLIPQTVNCDYFLHPSLLERDYQYLCGTGVVYLLAVYLGIDSDKMSILTMIATIADVMSLKGANVKIVLDGLEKLNQHCYRNVEMMDNFDFPVDEMDVSFKIIPKINAVGRMSEKSVSDVNQVVRYFLSDDIQEMNYLFRNIINALNDQRKKLSALEYQTCKQLCNVTDQINFIYVENLHVGILGLIASRIADETNKVTFILTNKGENIVGSVRSVKEIDIMEILNEFKENTINLGGHAHAAGITIAKENLELLKNFMLEKCVDFPEDTILPCLEIDKDELTIPAIEQLFKHHPYGQDRKLPLIMVTIPNDSLRSLKTENQLKWNYKGVDMVSFKNKGYAYYRDKAYVTLVGKLQINKFHGRTNYQILVSEVLD